MRRVPRHVLRMRVWIGLTVIKPYMKKALGLDLESYREAVADEIVNRMIGPEASEAVVLEPDSVGFSCNQRVGRWDEDEPRPHRDLPVAEH